MGTRACLTSEAIASAGNKVLKTHLRPANNPKIDCVQRGNTNSFCFGANGYAVFKTRQPLDNCHIQTRWCSKYAWSFDGPRLVTQTSFREKLLSSLRSHR